jgi:demethylspheroidene O-methyltransferase
MQSAQPGMPAPALSHMSLVERILAARDRLLASARFQRWAARMPLVKRIARRRAGELFDLCAGFVYSQVLYACTRLNLFEFLREGPQPLAALAQHMSMPAPSAQRLLDAAVALRLLEAREGERYGLGVLGASLNGNPGVLAMIEHHALLYADLADPLALLRDPQRDTRLRRYWAYARASDPAGLDEAQVGAYTTLMSASQHLVADLILDAYPLAPHRCLLDVGGGEGTFLLSAAGRAPHLRLMLFDLPPVARRAQQRFTAAGLNGRASAFGGSFLSEALPQGADIVSLVRVLHDHDDAAALTILRAVHRALPPGGTLLLGEPMCDERETQTMSAAYFGMYLFAMGQGRARTPAHIRQLLGAAGFDEVRLLRTAMPLQVSVVLARSSVNTT